MEDFVGVSDKERINYGSDRSEDIERSGKCVSGMSGKGDVGRRKKRDSNLHNDLHKLENVAFELARLISIGVIKDKTDFERQKLLLSSSLGFVPKNSLLFPLIASKVGWDLVRKFLRKPVRTLSGVAPIALMVRPENSCKWNCSYCPLSPLAPRSYIGYEPSSRRARQNEFHPYKQIKARFKQYYMQGHVPQKAEVIIQGGTFLAMENSYKEWFIRNIYYAFNDVWEEDIRTAKRLNEEAEHRIVGLTIETRPDVSYEKEINEMLYYGATRVELGVQHPDDKIYKLTKRGHLVKHVVESTKLLKDSAFKIVYHLMIGLPGSSVEKDKRMLREIVSNPSFMPDMVKLYPTVVVKEAELYKDYIEGRYIPFSLDDVVDIIVDFYKHIPPWVRVMRIQRDIPSNFIEGGVRKSNLRELVERRLKEEGIFSWEIRQREVGMKQFKDGVKYRHRNAKLELVEREYKASGGREVFLSFEDEEGLIYGLLRLRRADKPFRDEIEEGDGLVRELHVYGSQLPIGSQQELFVDGYSAQHKGIGRALLERAEEITAGWGGKVVVISGPGVRPYYRKLGYSLVGDYMVKKLN